MSRRRSKRERFDVNRGRHKKHASAETRLWEAEHMIPPKPPWMPDATYRRLARLREAC